MPMINDLRRARIAQETHPFQKVVTLDQQTFTGCMRCGLVLPPGLFMQHIPPCIPQPVQNP
jgi:hypothetical protein